MSKMSIKWHEECLGNMDRSIRMQIDNIEKLKSSLNRDRNVYTFYYNQICSAKQKNMDGFDRERFMVKKGEGK